MLKCYYALGGINYKNGVISICPRQSDQLVYAHETILPSEIFNHSNVKKTRKLLYENKIINIHPSLLPKYGGKGMYGIKIHAKVVKNKEKYSGITIHFVNEEYDSGAIIFQYKYELKKSETVESLSNEIQKIEHAFFPKIILDTIKKTEWE